MAQNKRAYRYITPACSWACKKRKRYFFCSDSLEEPFFQPAVNPPLMQPLRGRGNPMPKETEHFFGKMMGYHFGQVQVYTDQKAVSAARNMNAKAFTYGNHIVFNENQFNTSSSSGKRLLAHELVHVVQHGDDHEKISRVPLKEETEKKFSIKITAGDKEWRDSEIQLLVNALKKLNNKELEAVNGYEFIRWSNLTARLKTDRTYIQHSGPEENCYHEINLKAGISRITAYDACFGDPEAKNEKEFGLAPGEFRLLHEIGHLMQNADFRQTYLKARKAGDSETEATKDAVAAKDKSLKKFEGLTKGKPDFKDSDDPSEEHFAEDYAVFKADPDALKKKNPDLFKFFKANSFITK